MSTSTLIKSDPLLLMKIDPPLTILTAYRIDPVSMHYQYNESEADNIAIYIASLHGAICHGTKAMCLLSGTLYHITQS